MDWIKEGRGQGETGGNNVETVVVVVWGCMKRKWNRKRLLSYLFSIYLIYLKRNIFLLLLLEERRNSLLFMPLLCFPAFHDCLLLNIYLLKNLSCRPAATPLTCLPATMPAMPANFPALYSACTCSPTTSPSPAYPPYSHKKRTRNETFGGGGWWRREVGDFLGGGRQVVVVGVWWWVVGRMTWALAGICGSQ